MNQLNVSPSWRRASTATVSKTIDDLPEPDTPVKTVILFFGIQRHVHEVVHASTDDPDAGPCCSVMPAPRSAADRHQCEGERDRGGQPHAHPVHRRPEAQDRQRRTGHRAVPDPRPLPQSGEAAGEHEAGDDRRVQGQPRCEVVHDGVPAGLRRSALGSTGREAERRIGEEHPTEDQANAEGADQDRSPRSCPVGSPPRGCRR